MGLLQLLAKLFGKSYLNKIMGTRANVAKPIQMDKSSPFKRYSDSAYDDPEVVEIIEKKINEYGPYALNNKNSQELANFEANAKRLLDAKNRQTGTTPGMVDSMKPKPEAEMFGFETKQKLDDQGIMTLKKDMGLPPEVAPDSPLGKILTSRNKINQTLKGMGQTAEDIGAKAYSADIEGKRRAVVRQLLLKDDRLNLSAQVQIHLEDMADLGKNADPTMDPLVLFNKYYKRDNKKLEVLDDVIDESSNAKEAADNFLAKGDNLELLDDDLGTKLKDYDGDPDALADGGRPGFKFGSGVSFLKYLRSKLGKKNRQLTKDELEDFENEIGDSLEAYDFDGTVVDAERILKEDEAYKAEMFAEYKAGKLNPDESLAKAMDEVGGNFTGDLKYDADVLAPELAFQRGLIPEGGDLSDIADQMKQMDIYDEAYSAVSGQFLKNREIKKLSKPTQTLKSIEDTGTIDISNDEIAGEFEAFMRRTDPEGMKPIDALVEKINLKGKKRTDNAEGGRIGFSVGGAKVGMFGFQKLRELIRNLAKERGVQGSDILKLMNYKNLAPTIKSKFSKAEFDKFKLEIQKSKMKQLENFRDMFESKVKFNKSIEQGKALDDGGTGMSDIFSYMDESFSKGSPVPKNVNEEDVLKMDQLIKNQTVKDDPRKLNAQGGLNYLMGL